jgi:hypothetical protein
MATYRYQLFDGADPVETAEPVHEATVEVDDGPHFDTVEAHARETGKLEAGRQYRAAIAASDDQPAHTHVFDA